MISKNRVYIISSNVDDSIKKSTIHVDIQLFKTFKSFEEYIEINPIDAHMIIVNSKDLLFTNSAMNRLVHIIQSTFVSIEDALYYLVDNEEVKSKVDTICDRNGFDNIKTIYSPTLHARNIAELLNGDLLSPKETVTVVKTYRIRASEYEKSQKEKEELDYSEPYETDEDELTGVHLEEIPEDLRITETPKPKRFIIAADDLKERVVWAILKAQYLILDGRCLIVERDTNYHTTLDYISRLGIKYDFFDYKEMIRDVADVINRIKNSDSKLIVVGTKHKLKYNYDLTLSMLVSNLSDNINYYIYETNLNTIPYGEHVDVILPNTVPDILRGINSMSTIASFNDLHFVGLEITNLGNASLGLVEVKSLLSELFRENNLHVSVAKIQGLSIREEVGIGGILMYDRAANGRQNS